MPNWCNNFLTFFGDGTPEGLAAIKDMHSRIMKVQEMMGIIKNVPSYGTDIWEVYIAKYGYGVDINVYQRGYLIFVDNVDEVHQELKIETEDAWSPNIAFWYALTHYFYRDHVTFFFQASEPGMQIYETNDEGLLPRYSVQLYAEGVDECLEYDKLWNWDNPLFPSVKPGWNEYDIGIGFFGGGWNKRYTGQKDPVDGHCMLIDVYDFPTPCIEYMDEGDEDYIFEGLDSAKTFSPHTSLDNIDKEFKNNTLYVNSWEYCSTDDAIRQEDVCYNICKNMWPEDHFDDDKGERNAVTPIYDNFTTFGGNNNG